MRSSELNSLSLYKNKTERCLDNKYQNEWLYKRFLRL